MIRKILCLVARRLVACYPQNRLIQYCTVSILHFFILQPSVNPSTRVAFSRPFFFAVKMANKLTCQVSANVLHITDTDNNSTPSICVRWVCVIQKQRRLLNFAVSSAPCNCTLCCLRNFKLYIPLLRIAQIYRVVVPVGLATHRLKIKYQPVL